MFVQPSLLQTGMTGIQKGVQGLEMSATNVVNAQTFDSEAASKENGRLLQGLVGLSVYEIQVKASAKVVEVADENIGTLIDIKT